MGVLGKCPTFFLNRALLRLNPALSVLCLCRTDIQPFLTRKSCHPVTSVVILGCDTREHRWMMKREFKIHTNHSCH